MGDMNYQGNSKKKKASEDGAVERTPREKVISGTARQRKKPLGRSIAETFTGDDAQSVGQYILFDVVIPTVKDMIYNAFSQGLERSLFGSGRAPSSSRGGGRPGGGSRHTAYNRVYKDEPTVSRSIGQRARATHNFDEIILDTRNEAEEVLEHLVMLVGEYDVASVNDLYDLVGITGNFTDENWGWTNLQDAGVRRTRDGYLVELPKPTPID